MSTPGRRQGTVPSVICSQLCLLIKQEGQLADGLWEATRLLSFPQLMSINYFYSRQYIWSHDFKISFNRWRACIHYQRRSAREATHEGLPCELPCVKTAAWTQTMSFILRLVRSWDHMFGCWNFILCVVYGRVLAVHRKQDGSPSEFPRPGERLSVYRKGKRMMATRHKNHWSDMFFPPIILLFQS